MSEAQSAPAPPRGPARRPSTSTAEFVDVLHTRRSTLVAVAVGVAVLGMLAAAVAPTVLPPRPLAGAAVGVAACLLAVAGALALDAADRVVRGPRHVRVTGAVHAATVGAHGTGPLVDWTEQRLRAEGSLRLAIAGAGVDQLRSGHLTDDVARSLARRGWRVLRVSLHQPDGHDGVAEVVVGERRLTEVVDYHPTLDLAELGPGHDLDAALDGFPSLVARLPRDVDALLVALPGVRQPGVLPAVAATDGILLLAEAGTTTRVELIAALDALDEARVPSEVVLLEPDARIAGPDARVAGERAEGPEPERRETADTAEATEAPEAPQVPAAPTLPGGVVVPADEEPVEEPEGPAEEEVEEPAAEGPADRQLSWIEELLGDEAADEQDAEILDAAAELGLVDEPGGPPERPDAASGEEPDPTVDAGSDEAGSDAESDDAETTRADDTDDAEDTVELPPVDPGGDAPAPPRPDAPPDGSPSPPSPPEPDLPSPPPPPDHRDDPPDPVAHHRPRDTGEALRRTAALDALAGEVQRRDDT